MHCLAAVPDERGSLVRVHVQTLAAFLRTFVQPPSSTDASDASSTKFCGDEEGDRDGNELLAQFAPCILLAGDCAL